MNPFRKIRELEHQIELQTALKRIREEQVQQAQAQALAERARADRLEAVIIEMRREGFNPPAPVVKREAEPVLPDEVLQAIEKRAINPTVAAQLEAEARALLQKKTDPDLIAAGILSGGEIELDEI